MDLETYSNIYAVKKGYINNTEKYSNGQFINEFIGNTRKGYYFNGKLRIEEQYNKDGLLHGYQKGYDPDGTLCYENNYINDDLKGISRKYFNGQLIFEKNFK